VKHASDWLRELRKKAAETKGQTAARKEATAGAPEIRQHPLLSILKKRFTTVMVTLTS
jgi:hypothetical protein